VQGFELVAALSSSATCKP